MALWGLVLLSCSQSSSINNVSFALDSLNVLRTHISFDAPVGNYSYVEYWEKSDSLKQKTWRSPAAEGNHATLIALLPETEYTFQIVSEHDQGKSPEVSPGYNFTTGVLPDSLPKLRLVKNKGDVFDGYILVRRVLNPGSALLINNQGKVVWYEKVDTTLMNPFSWTENHTILSLDHPKRINEIDLFGRIVFQLEYGQKGYDRPLHHEIRKDKNGNILALTKEDQVFDLTKMGGQKQDTVHGDGILVLDPEGNKLWSWNIFQVANPLDDPNIVKTKGDWSHANSLNVLSDGNYIISFHHFDEVWKINANTGELMWKLGASGKFNLDDEDLFYKQHAAHQISDGSIMIFDNGDDKRQRSRALQLQLDETNLTAKSQLSVYLPDSLFSFKQGSSFLMDSDKILFCISTKNKIAITDFNGEVLWQLNADCSFYRAVYVPAL